MLLHSIRFTRHFIIPQKHHQTKHPIDSVHADRYRVSICLSVFLSIFPPPLSLSIPLYFSRSLPTSMSLYPSLSPPFSVYVHRIVIIISRINHQIGDFIAQPSYSISILSTQKHSRNCNFRKEYKYNSQILIRLLAKWLMVQPKSRKWFW